jgi:hypothetical protein
MDPPPANTAGRGEGGAGPVRSARAAKKVLRDRILGFDRPGPVTAWVSCNGADHRIVFDGQRLQLPDHPKLSRDEILFEFGDECRCLEVREGWRKRIRELLPQALWWPFDWCREGRFRDRQPDPDPALVYHRATAQALRQALENCHYRLGRLSTSSVDVYLGRHCYCDGHSRRGTHSIPTFVIDDRWFGRVFRTGRCVIDGRLVLAVLTENEIRLRRLLQSRGERVPSSWWLKPLGENPDLTQGPFVLAVYQDRWNRFHSRPARVVRGTGPDGVTREVLEPVRNGSGV